MQKIDKKKILSTKYKKWLDNLDDKNHPKYSSSSFRFYQDIKMSLLYCQNGLCAYSEKFLCSPEFLKKENWDDTEYIKELDKEELKEIKGDLEHFDESLKSEKAWLWKNLFIVDTYINRVKGTQPINNILKPDEENYNPYEYLDFNYDTGRFFPKVTLKKDDKENVEYMIKTLGINIYHTERKKRLKSFLLEYEMKEILEIEVDVYEYLTAWKMTLQALKEEQEL